MAETELRVILKAKDLAEHTMRITSNCNRYPKKYRFSLVDKMPNEPKECIFSECTNHLHDSYICNLYRGRGCEPNKCNFLKPIMDYHAVEHMGDNMVKMIPIE